MELVFLFLALLLVGAVCYAILCFLFFGLTDRPVLLAFKLCFKLSFGSIVGVAIFGFGALLLPTIWINAAIEPLPNYSKMRDIAIGFIITTICCVIMYVFFFAMAWGTLG